MLWAPPPKCVPRHWLMQPVRGLTRRLHCLQSPRVLMYSGCGSNTCSGPPAPDTAAPRGLPWLHGHAVNGTLPSGYAQPPSLGGGGGGALAYPVAPPGARPPLPLLPQQLLLSQQQVAQLAALAPLHGIKPELQAERRAGPGLGLGAAPGPATGHGWPGVEGAQESRSHGSHGSQARQQLFELSCCLLACCCGGASTVWPFMSMKLLLKRASEGFCCDLS